MNPCRCGYISDANRACSRAPKCAIDYQAKISGPLFDRIDLHVDVPEVSAADLIRVSTGESSFEVAKRVKKARMNQQIRYEALETPFRLNAHVDGELLEKVALPDDAGQKILKEAAEKFKLSARSYRRVLRVARTLADMGDSLSVSREHIAEALSYRRLHFST